MRGLVGGIFGAGGRVFHRVGLALEFGHPRRCRPISINAVTLVVVVIFCTFLE